MFPINRSALVCNQVGLRKKSAAGAGAACNTAEERTIMGNTCTDSSIEVLPGQSTGSTPAIVATVVVRHRMATSSFRAHYLGKLELAAEHASSAASPHSCYSCPSYFPL